MNVRANTTIDQREALREVFGKHPEDVLETVKRCGEVLSWIEEILHIAAREDEENNEIGFRRLISAAKYLASDFGNYFDCEHESMRDSLSKHSGTVTEALP